ncbi:hypothetical protein MMC26_002017 [Xylographa opegraphella]|nr:hypothetical protein [Xylographa opegraphella]
MVPFLSDPQAPMSSTRSPGTIVQDSFSDNGSSTSNASTTKKRKRETNPVEEIEVDIDAPEPPSKKALRKAKKGKPLTKTTAPKLVTDDAVSDSDSPDIKVSLVAQRSEHAIWIGNLPWIASKDDLRKFLTSNAKIDDDAITRIHMPVPTQPPVEAARQRIKPQNKGFAYVDFATESAVTAAMALSETLLSGRRVLIKHAKSFEGRPDPLKEGEEKNGLQQGKPPSVRIFVGNLAFDTTKEELEEHFTRCGEVTDCFMATFQDTGKCKGYAWVTFSELEDAVKAVRGWVDMKASDEESDEEEVDRNVKEEVDRDVKESSVRKKPKKVRKWWVNRIKGRELRMEFAEDKAVRYKKRFGKGGTAGRDGAGGENAAEASVDTGATNAAESVAGTAQQKPSSGKNRRPSSSSGPYVKKVDARTVKPGAALAGAQRLTGAILPSQGKKITFE